MSSVIDPKVAPFSPEPADFHIGWRDVEVRLADGSTDIVRVPLTLEDALHPQFGDVLVESSLYHQICGYLSSVFRSCFGNDPTKLVLSDTQILWDFPELKWHAPDVCVISGIKQPKPEWPSFDVEEEQTRPQLIIELVTPSTRSNDIEKKFQQYHQAQVPCYVILDRKKNGDPWKLMGYEYSPAGYLPMPKDKRGRLWLKDVGVWLEVAGQEVWCYDGETDTKIGDITKFREQVKQLNIETTRAIEEKARAEKAEVLAQAKIHALEEELRLLRGEQK